MNLKTNKKRSNVVIRTKKAAAGFMVGALTAGCLLGTAVPVMANTDISYGTGVIEIDNIDGQVTTFKGFKVFDCNVNEDGTASNIAWPNTATKNAVIGVIQKFDETYTSTNAQDAADFISAKYKDANDNLTTDQTTVLESAELLNQIAAAVDDVTVTKSMKADTAYDLAEGYWLFVTDGTSVDVDEDGTSPIFALCSGGLITIVEKTSLPTVDKVVLNDADGADWTYGAEAERGQSVSHKITGTVASNIKTYDLYYYEFEDVMSKGIDYDMGSYKVEIDGVDVTKYFKETLVHNDGGNDKLSVACEDILAISGVKVNASSKIILTYTVQLNDDCVIGVEGNPNDVDIIYSSNPNTREKSKTHVVRDYLYSYGLHLEKKDRDTNVSLAGAKFTIQATDPDDASSTGLYVQGDGRLGTTPFEFVTDENGEFEVTGLDAGTYTLHETQCPEAYQVVNEDTQFTIESTYNEDGTISTLTNTVSGNADAAAGIDTTDDNQVDGDEGTAAIVKTCYVNVTVGNIEKIKMPLSGQSGAGLMVAIGGGVLLLSAGGAVLVLRRKKRTENA